MKKQTPLLIALLLFLLISSSSFGQSGKPQYNLRCEREGTFIGNIKVELFPLITPLHVNNFDSLVNIQFYDTTAFHRVVPNFVIQGGDPNSRHGDPSTWGFGDPTQTNVPAEFTDINHARGILGAARDEDFNSANSQFFINVVENSGLNRQYTAYGKIYEGMDVADTIVNSPTVPGTERPLQKIEMFVTYLGVNNNIPTAPTLISPLEGEPDIIASQDFEWTSVPDAVLYRFQLSTDSTFATTAYDTLVGFPEFTANSFELGFVKHFWRVQANNGGTVSDFSEVRSFISGIDIPDLIAPPDSSVNISTDLTFEWSPVTGAVSYRLQVATNAVFIVGIVLNQPNITGTSYGITGLDPDKKYFWRVKGATDTYEGLYSHVSSFTTTSATSVNDNELIYSYELKQNHPNPFNPSTKISYTILEASFVSLKVYDVLGIEVATLVNFENPSGSYEVWFDAVGLPSGIYFYQLKAGSFTDIKKMLLIK